MSKNVQLAVTAGLALIGFGSAANSRATDQGKPTCSETLGIVVHGQHVIGDYVTGTGHEELGWPPNGADIGETTSANGGVVVRGGPGPGFHFEHGVAPGASFCTDSRSPGAHL